MSRVLEHPAHSYRMTAENLAVELENGSLRRFTICEMNERHGRNRTSKRPDIDLDDIGGLHDGAGECRDVVRGCSRSDVQQRETNSSPLTPFGGGLSTDVRSRPTCTNLGHRRTRVDVLEGLGHDVHAVDVQPVEACDGESTVARIGETHEGESQSVAPLAHEDLCKVDSPQYESIVEVPLCDGRRHVSDEDPAALLVMFGVTCLDGLPRRSRLRGELAKRRNLG